MYLKRLEIHGFKTFADKTDLVFTPGITAIIGPNGVGKSNIADALLWVLGEHNVRNIRGELLQDVIFSGNESRRALSRAQVTVTLDNSSGALPLDFQEVSVTRRVFRNGDSEYEINQTRCRLRDITELFLDTGLGRGAYSMISQGEIDQILSVRPEDRRRVFEEAAGVAKYRARKHQAELKLEATQRNLLRVADILSELERSLGPLRRQAEGAKKYHGLASELRELEFAWFGQRLQRLDRQQAELSQLQTDIDGERQGLQTDLAEAREREQSAEIAYRVAETALAGVRTTETRSLESLASLESERARAEERVGEVARRQEALGKDLDGLTERVSSAQAAVETRRIAVEQRGLALAAAQDTTAQARERETTAADALATVRRAWDDLQAARLNQERQRSERASRLAAAEQRVVSLDETVERVSSDLAAAGIVRQEAAGELASAEHGETALRQAADDAAANRQQAGKGLLEAEKALNEARETQEQAHRESAGLTGRLEALREMTVSGEDGAEALLAAAASGYVPGRWARLVDGLQVPLGLELAVDAALGPYGGALLVDEWEHADAGLDWLRQHGGAALILVASDADGSAAVDGTLAPLVEASPAVAGWARRLLSRAQLVEALPADPTRLAEDSTVELWVTAEGEWRSADGAVYGGQPESGDGVASELRRQAEIERLEGELQRAGESVAVADAALKQAAEKHGIWLEQAGTAAEKSQHSRHDLAAIEKDVRRLSTEAERAERRHRALAVELENAEQERQRAREQLTSLQSGDESVQERPDGGADDEALRAQLADRQRAQQEAQHLVGEARVAETQAEERRQQARDEQAAAIIVVEGLEKQRERWLLEQRTLTGESQQRTLSFESMAERAQTAEQEIQTARREMAALTEQRTAADAALQEARVAARDFDERLREIVERLHQVQIELGKVEGEHRRTEAQWLDSLVAAHNLEFSESAEVDPESGEINLESVRDLWDAEMAEITLRSVPDPEGDIVRLRRRIRALGPINPDAVEEYASSSERFEFLSTQKADLEGAQEQLLEAIREIDEASRDIFHDAFQVIAEAFDRMFRRLFGGGSTKLTLTDPTDVLETGIEINVQPPGKRRQNLALLSGGERALTASALMFALLEVRPSPFCVLDELDAPLDDANVGRFADVLKSLTDRTQFLVITHNRGTMEAADTLYGVTMQTKGVSSVLSCQLSDPIVQQVEREAELATAD